MLYIIDEISNTGDGGLFVLVRFWTTRADHDRADSCACRESFSWPHLQRSGRRVVRDGRGWAKRASDGVYVDTDTIEGREPEWEREDYDVDIRGKIRASIRRYWTNRQAAQLSARPWPRDHADHRVRRVVDDPRSLRGEAVTDLVGVEREEL